MPTSTLTPTINRTGDTSNDGGPVADRLTDPEFLNHCLMGVSRTFALTIPQLPRPLDTIVANAYLLCRIVDTIEDEPRLTFEQKELFCGHFLMVVDGKKDPLSFSESLHPLLSSSTSPQEKELVKNTARVVAITQRFSPAPRRAIARCLQIMAKGMVGFQRNQSSKGLPDLKALNRYCYVVAGVVGEMLTEFFCYYSERCRKNKDDLMALAVSFGQGLQMTNILKDIWEDYLRGVCWMPRALFEKEGYALERLQQQDTDASFERAFEYLIGIAHQHLKNALEYVLLLPRKESSIRSACLQPLGLAMLTLKKINAHRQFKDAQEVKISRKSVKRVVAFSRLAARNNLALRLFFRYVRRDLPLVLK